MQQIPPAPQHEHRDERRAHDRDGPRPRLLSRLRSGSGLLRHGSYADRTMGAARADDPVLESRLSALGAACGHHRSRADRALRGSPARAWARRAARGRRRPSAGSGAHPHVRGRGGTILPSAGPKPDKHAQNRTTPHVDGEPTAEKPRPREAGRVLGGDISDPGHTSPRLAPRGQRGQLARRLRALDGDRRRCWRALPRRAPRRPRARRRAPPPRSCEPGSVEAQLHRLDGRERRPRGGAGAEELAEHVEPLATASTAIPSSSGGSTAASADHHGDELAARELAASRRAERVGRDGGQVVDGLARLVDPDEHGAGVGDVEGTVCLAPAGGLAELASTPPLARASRFTTAFAGRERCPGPGRQRRARGGRRVPRCPAPGARLGSWCFSLTSMAEA